MKSKPLPPESKALDTLEALKDLRLCLDPPNGHVKAAERHVRSNQEVTPIVVLTSSVRPPVVLSGFDRALALRNVFGGHTALAELSAFVVLLHEDDLHHDFDGEIQLDRDDGWADTAKRLLDELTAGQSVDLEELWQALIYSRVLSQEAEAALEFGRPTWKVTDLVDEVAYRWVGPR